MSLAKLFYRLVFVILLLPALVFSALAEEDQSSLQAVVSGHDVAKVGEKTSFDASRSHNPFTEKPAVYAWRFGGVAAGSGEKIDHVFKKAGTSEVELTMRVGNESSIATFPIFIYERPVVLVSDMPIYEEQITALVEEAKEKNIFLDVAWGAGAREGFFAEESAVSTVLQEKLDTIKDTNLIILWTNGSNGLNGLTRFAQDLNPPIDLSGKQIVVVTDGSLDAMAKIARGAFSTLNPASILLIHDEAVRSVLMSEPGENIVESFNKRAVPHRLLLSGLEEFSITSPLGFLVNYLMAKGIPASVILLVLLLPVIATLVAFFKQVVGFTTFGVYTPSVLVLSFLAIGLRLGLAVLLVVVLASMFIRAILKRKRLAYTPRLAIILTFVALAILAAIVFLTWFEPFGGYTNMADIIAASIFPMLIMSTLAEKFASIQTEKGSRSAVRLFVEVMLVSVVCYFIVGRWSYLHTLMLSTPEIIFLFLVADIVIGRFTGLRLTEYIRFKDVIKKTEEE